MNIGEKLYELRKEKKLITRRGCRKIKRIKTKPFLNGKQIKQHQILIK